MAAPLEAIVAAYFAPDRLLPETWARLLSLTPSAATSFCQQLVTDNDADGPNPTRLPPLSYVGMWPNAYYKLLARCLWVWQTTGVCPVLTQLPPPVDGVVEDTGPRDRLATIPLAIVEDLGTTTRMDAFVVAIGGARGIVTLLGVRCTAGSQVLVPPTAAVCMDAFNRKHGDANSKSKLTIGGRQWTKHAQRSLDGWWGVNKGSEAQKNALGEAKVRDIMASMVWMNTHGLPNGPIVLEIRQKDGYGARWGCVDGDVHFRGFVEPYMADGHAVGWVH
ncbi:hypothetical protein SDRG_07864 [Saprolegnia diclina VS20]|uniref:Uncharacterized protein n=1 Tax=Saprolegnia diclina (strain VS20) TaxID=1156394 RepID=T0RW53_SAPDV|nr:hypothetical protein SDRG_07864 [Saprolegnia diclina VS20]EQC34537.1 hypothetical protein SDRG_07864 [Saprolegnia diclina VS20]|eukprot:XP_008611943.1 hypothetical protein SDRG_07864 [Saprolegnia diclina VS20]